MHTSAFYFGANEKGPQPAAELAFVARHALVGWGWQQGYDDRSRGGEALGQAAAAALRSIAPVGSGNTTPDAVFVYRQSEGLFPLYSLMADLNSSLLAAALARDPVNRSQLCGKGGLLGYSDDEFVQYWVDTVGGEIAGEEFVDCVFYDGFDKLYAGNTLASQGCPGFTPSATATELRHKLAAMARQADVLNARGRLPILSTYNFFAKAAASLGGGSLARESDLKAQSMNGVFEGEPFHQHFLVATAVLHSCSVHTYMLHSEL